MESLQRRMATGLRVERPSDDPFATLGIMALSSARSLTFQHKETSDSVASNLRLAEARVGEMDDAMKEAKRIAIQGANATTSQEGRSALARQVASLQERLLQSANARDGNGKFMFSGFRVTTMPFEVNNSTPPPPYLIHNGDAGRQMVEVGPGTSLQANTLLDAQVMQAYEALEDTRRRLEAGDASGLSGVSLEKIDLAAQEVRTLRGEIGVRIRRFEDASVTAERRSDEFTRQISDRQDADLIETIVDLQKAQMAYQASLAAIASANNLSLLEYIRG